MYKHLNEALQKYAVEIQAALKSTVPVRTGSLKNSIQVTARHNGSFVTLLIDLNYYYQFLKPPVPAYEAVNLIDIHSPGRYVPVANKIAYYQNILSQALEQDIIEQFYATEIG